MKSYMGLSKQRGVALIVTLVLLVVALVLGLSSYQSSRLDESMAGNQHAVGKAFMAAEFGASGFWGSDSVVISPSGWGPGQGSIEQFDSVDGYDWVGVGDNAFYRVLSPHLVRPNGIDYEVVVEGSFAPSVDVAGDESYASRYVSVVVEPEGMGFRNLSPLNFISAIVALRGINSQAELEGELVEGRRNPAIAAGSRADALRLVEEVAGNRPSEKYTFVPDDPSNPGGDGVYYASPTVDGDGRYTGDYSACNSGNNRLCNYKGGISTKPAEKIFDPSDAGAFANFISTVFSAYGESGSHNFTNQLSGGFSGVSVVSNIAVETGPVEYSPLRTCENDVCNYPERVTFEGGNDLRGDGILIIDGNAEFRGDPSFDGLIIVLGDYTVKGGGGDDFNGAIIAAPYSCEVGGGCGFDPLDVDARGGGNNDYLHNMEALDAAWTHLRNLSPQAAMDWYFSNRPEGQDFVFRPISISERLISPDQ